MRRAIWPSLLTGALLLTTVARADDVTIRRDTVVPVVFNETIDGGKAKVGDGFTARVDGGRDLPPGAVLRGRIESIGKRDGNKTFAMRFNEVRLPDGGRYAIVAMPVALNSDLLKRAPDGRITAKRNDRKRETQVLGGLLGGLAVGSIFGKAKEGAILGTLIGAGVAIADKGSGQEVVVKKGQRYGAMFDQEVTLSLANRLEGQDPYDAIRDRNSDPASPGPVGSGDGPMPVETASARLYRDGKAVEFRDAAPIQEDGTLWLPIREAARALDLTFTDETEKDANGVSHPVYTVEGNDRMLEVDDERGRIRLDGRRQDDLKILRRDGVLYVPLAAFSPLVQERLTSEPE